MADLCPVCGANYALVGHAHNCKPLPVNPGTGSAQHPARVSGEVNAVNLSQDGVNKEVNPVNSEQLMPVNKPKRGDYPNTDKRREYMRNYMLKKRRGKL
jgi:predicted kinase